jgi:hypothetical protein
MATATVAAPRRHVSTRKSTNKIQSANTVDEVLEKHRNLVEEALARHWKLLCDEDPKTIVAENIVHRMLRNALHCYFLLDELQRIGMVPVNEDYRRVFDIFSVLFLAGWEAGLRAGVPSDVAMHDAELLRDLTTT